MDAEVTTLSKNAAPRTDYRVRRRRYNATSFLVFHNDWYELDEIADSVWMGCDRGLTVEQLVLETAAAHNLPLGEALAATAYAIEQFRSHGLLRIE